MKDFEEKNKHWFACDSMCAGCPFAMTEESEAAQNLGCLPTPQDIFALMDEQEANWSCHEQDGKLCAGYVARCRDTGTPFKGRPMFRSETYLRTGKRLLMTQPTTDQDLKFTRT